MVQRSCPHLKADLTRFGEEKDGILTCTLHGWQFDLVTGKCLTSDENRLNTKPITEKWGSKLQSAKNVRQNQSSIIG
jgi:UDP-MurNAc hydroxylase